MNYDNLFEILTITNYNFNKFISIRNNMDLMDKEKIIFMISILIVAILNQLVTNVSAQNITQNNTQLLDIQKLTSITFQNTSVSLPSASAKINNQEVPHSIVVALPIRADEKIWAGTVTFTASKPIEVEVLHKYIPITKPDDKHGEPSNGKWFDGTPIALSTMTMFSNTPVTITDKPYSAGSFTFAGSALIFHKTNGQPFSVTYTLDAVAKNITK
jgi:hypothetical protein